MIYTEKVGEGHLKKGGGVHRKPGPGPLYSSRQLTEQELNMLAALAKLHCSWEEMAAALSVHKNYLQRHYSEFVEKNKCLGLTSIRAKQIELAMKGDKTLLIWVGKQLLGQTDRSYSQVDSKVESKNVNVNLNRQVEIEKRSLVELEKDVERLRLEASRPKNFLISAQAPEVEVTAVVEALDAAS